MGAQAAEGGLEKRSFKFRSENTAGSRIWNSLPDSVRHSASIGVFRSKLKTSLFQSAFSCLCPHDPRLRFDENRHVRVIKFIYHIIAVMFIRSYGSNQLFDFLSALTVLCAICQCYLSVYFYSVSALEVLLYKRRKINCCL